MGSGVLKPLFGVFAALVLVGLLSVGDGRILLNEAPTSSSSSAAAYTEIFSRDDRASVHPDLGLNYMSKRRVPNGPDPIHNRGAGKSRQPPGRA